MLLLLLACTADAPGDDTAPGGDTALPGDTFSEVSVVVSDVVTTSVRVTWRTDAATDGWVEVAPPDGSAPVVVRSVDTPDADGIAHEALLFGLAADTRYELTLGGTVDGAAVTSEPVPVTTGSLPNDLPDLYAEVVEPDAGDGYMAVGILSTRSTAAILDAQGRYVWWWENPDGDNLTTRVARSRDGRSVLAVSHPNADSSDGSGVFRIYRVSYDGEVVTSFDAPDLHHDFVELPDGTIAWLSYDIRTVQGTAVHGDRLMETTPDGETRQVWTCWDSYAYEDVPPDVTAGTEFLHANVVRYDEQSDAYWVGMRNVSQIIRLDRATGAELDRIGGTDSDYALSSGSPTSGQHSFSILDDGFVVLDNRADWNEPTRVVQFRLGDATMEEVWSYTAPANFHEFGLGDAIRLESGNTRIVWSSSGELDEVTPEGEILWQVNLDAGFGFGYGQYTTDPQVWP